MRSKIRAVIGDVLEKSAPEELFVLKDYDPTMLSPGAARHGPLNSGIEAMAAMLLPILWKVVESLFSDVASEISKEASKVFVQVLRKILTQNSSTDQPPQELIDEITKRLIDEGVDLDQYPTLAMDLSLAFMRHYHDEKEN